MSKFEPTKSTKSQCKTGSEQSSFSKSDALRCSRNRVRLCRSKELLDAVYGTDERPVNKPVQSILVPDLRLVSTDPQKVALQNNSKHFEFETGLKHTLAENHRRTFTGESFLNN